MSHLQERSLADCDSYVTPPGAVPRRLNGPSQSGFYASRCTPAWTRRPSWRCCSTRSGCPHSLVSTPPGVRQRGRGGRPGAAAAQDRARLAGGGHRRGSPAAAGA
eukprot:1196333-Prorocentrum_minimum.AAC.3